MNSAMKLTASGISWVLIGAGGLLFFIGGRALHEFAGVDRLIAEIGGSGGSHSAHCVARMLEGGGWSAIDETAAISRLVHNPGTVPLGVSLDDGSTQIGHERRVVCRRLNARIEKSLFRLRANGGKLVVVVVHFWLSHFSMIFLEALAMLRIREGLPQICSQLRTPKRSIPDAPPRRIGFACKRR